jgi:hypothetical protein
VYRDEETNGSKLSTLPADAKKLLSDLPKKE